MANGSANALASASATDAVCFDPGPEGSGEEEGMVLVWLGTVVLPVCFVEVEAVCFASASFCFLFASAFALRDSPDALPPAWPATTFFSCSSAASSGVSGFFWFLKLPNTARPRRVTTLYTPSPASSKSPFSTSSRTSLTVPPTLLTRLRSKVPSNESGRVYIWWSHHVTIVAYSPRAAMLLSCTAGSKPKVLSKFTDMARCLHHMR